MAKKVLGIDIGFHSLKLALCRDGNVLQAVTVDTPENLLRDGQISSTEAMADLLHMTMKSNHIRASRAAVVLPNELTYLRTVTMPRMTAEQLVLNIPYEFNDYIEDEPKNYVFDYAMLTDVKKEPGETMELMAVAAPVSLLAQSREILGKAGMRLVKAAPTEYAYVSLLRRLERDKPGRREYCILDLGYRAVRMFMFRGDQHVVTRVLEIGLRNVDEVVSEVMNVDIHIARAFMEKNYEDVHARDFCISAYNNIAVELMRALNFYRFSNPDSTLSDVWLCGGGAGIEPLRDVISETLRLNVHPAQELLDGAELPEAHHFTQAVGITLD